MNKKGFTLLEIVISLSIMVVILASLTMVFTQGVSLTTESDSLSRSEMKVRKAIEGEKIAGVRIESADQTLTFQIGSATFTVPGTMKTYSDAKGRVNYKVFEVNPNE